MISEFVFWQDALSMHQSALIRCLAEATGGRVKLVVWEELNPSRRAAKWSVPDFGRAEIIIRPGPPAVYSLLSNASVDSVHIFSGPRGHPFVNAALREALGSSASIGLMAEAHDGRGPKGLLRYLRCRSDAQRLGGRISFVLAIGMKAVRWYTATHYPRTRIFPFAYFVESPAIAGDDRHRSLSPGQPFDLIFVAELIHLKGWDVLLRALSAMPKQDWRLHVVGDGADREDFLALQRELGLASSVCFYGRLKHPEVIALISRSDLLVLPSRWDGWGAVVNEALMCGVPAICSDRCGAMDLLDGRVRGEVFQSASVPALRATLTRWIRKGKVDNLTRGRIRRWARCICGESAAGYLQEVVGASTQEGPHPRPPWLSGEM